MSAVEFEDMSCQVGYSVRVKWLIFFFGVFSLGASACLLIG